MSLLATCLLCLPIYNTQTDKVTEETITPPIEDIWLTSKDGKQLYSKTKADSYGWPTWKISQWSIPEQLPGFKEVFKNVWVTKNQHAKVIYNFNYNHVSLESIGEQLDCIGSTEFDLLLSPVFTTEFKPLDRLNKLILSFDINPDESKVIGDDCTLNKGGHFIAVTLANRKDNKVFYYQLQLEATWGASNEFWWRLGDLVDGKIRYGYRGQLSSYGLSPPLYGKFNKYEIDVLPEVESLLMEQGEDPGDWKFSGLYMGSYIWGRVHTLARWKNIKVITKY